MTLDLHADVSGGKTVTQTFVQTLLLDNTPYVAPGPVGSIKSSAVTSQGSSTYSLYTRGWMMMSLICWITLLSMVW